MRRILVTVFLVAAALGVPGPAAAQEPRPQELRAHKGWLSWWEDGERWFEHRSGVIWVAEPHVFQAVDLGPDAKRAQVVVYSLCRGPAARPDRQACSVHEARIPYNSPFRTLVRRRDRFGVTALGQHRGTLVLGQWRGRFGDSSRVLLKRPGDSHFTTIAKRRAARRIDIDEGFVMYLDKQGEEVPAVWVVDLRGARPRTRRIAGSTDNGCRCSNGAVKVRDATLDGPHVYWIEEVTRADGDAPLGTGGSSTTTTRILRVDLRDPAAAVEGHVVGRPRTLAVAGGLVFHDDREEFTTGYRPDWAPAEPFLPVES